MMRNMLVPAGFAVLALTAAVLGCDRSTPTVPTRPVAPSPQPPTPAPTPTPIVTRLTVEGPGSVPPGQTAEYTATASFADGSTRDVTKEVVWRVEPGCCADSPGPVLTVSVEGVVTALRAGEAFVSASLATRRSSRNVLVLPAGTFRHHGFVDDGGVPVSGATVIVTEGVAAGLSTTTEPNGNYRLYGVAGPTDIAVSKPGYVEQKQELTVTSNIQSLVFHLALSEPRADVAGVYTLTVIAAPECASRLPPAARERRYEAVLAQSGARVTATLEGATFYQSGGERYNRFYGAVEPAGVTFRLNEGSYYYHHDVLEQLTAATYFSMWGSVVLTGSSARRSGTLEGVIAVLGGSAAENASCASKAHRFELTR